MMKDVSIIGQVLDKECVWNVCGVARNVCSVCLVVEYMFM